MDGRKPDDGELKQRIADELFWDSLVDETQVTVEVAGGDVTLTGQVPTAAARYRAEADARHVNGVLTVDNQLQINPSKCMPDAELLSNVRNTLFWSPEIDATDLEVYSSGGGILLRGRVTTIWQKVRAHQLVAGVSGVRTIINEVQVVPKTPVDDASLRTRLADCLHRQLPVDSRNLQLHVVNGHVILEGHSDNHAALEFVERLVEKTPGIVAFDNRVR